MDARIDAFKAFGLSPGDAHVIRNAGGSAQDAVRSLVISQQMLGTNAIYLVKHTSKLGGLQLSRHCKEGLNSYRVHIYEHSARFF